MIRLFGTRARAWLGLVALIVALLPRVAGAAHSGTVYGTGGDGVWLKDGPSLDAARIIVLPEGTPFQLLQGPIRSGDQGYWARVEALGNTGWMSAEYLLMDGSPTPVYQTPPPDPASVSAPQPAVVATGGTATVIDTAPVGGLRLRAAPAPWETLIAILPDGTTLQIVDGPITGGNGDPWFKVLAGGQEGWVDGIYLAPAAPPPAASGSLAVGGWAAVNGAAEAGGLRLRAAPSPAEQLLTILPEGTKLRILEGPAQGANGDPWFRVAWEGSWGWVDGIYLIPTTAPTAAPPASGTAAGQAFVKIALAQVGKPYTWGGAGPNTFDCSGLTLYAARKALGITLPRTADAQAWSGVHVDRDKLVPGDLVFYANTYGPGITHVGIYLGNNRWVSAQDEQAGIVVESLDTPYWKTRYAGARRIT